MEVGGLLEPSAKAPMLNGLPKPLIPSGGNFADRTIFWASAVLTGHQQLMGIFASAEVLLILTAGGWQSHFRRKWGLVKVRSYLVSAAEVQ